MTAPANTAEKAKHTPGPWQTKVEDELTGQIEIVSDRRPYVCTVHPGGINNMTEANALLIAAAPELLEALQAAMRFIDSHVADPDITRDMADAWSDLQRINPHTLIAKATGATP